MLRVQISAASALIRAGLESLLASEGIGTSMLDSDLPADVLVAEEMPAELTGLPVVLLVESPLPDWAAEALRNGARGLLPTQVDAAELASAVRAAAAGLVTIHPQFLDELLTNPAVPITSGGILSPREIEVLRMLADGLGNKNIAYRLNISEHTVKFHVASIMAKLDAGSRTEAVTQGIRRGLIML